MTNYRPLIVAAGQVVELPATDGLLASLMFTQDSITLNSETASDAASEGVGLVVTREGSVGSLIYKNASATRWAAGDAGSEVDLVGTTSTQTLTNKTLTAPVINSLITGTYTIGGNPTFPSTVVLTTASQTLTNKTLTSPTISSPTFSGTISGTYTIGGSPTFPSTVVTTTGSQTLTNKTLTSPNITGATVTVSGLDVAAAGNKTVFGSVGNNTLTIGGSGTTVLIAGNLQVDGTTVTVNSSTLDVEDKNITISKGGNDAASEGAGITVERTSTDGSLIYKNDSATRWAAGDVGSEVDLVGTTSTQTLTNKTLTDPIVEGELTVSDLVSSGTIDIAASSLAIDCTTTIDGLVWVAGLVVGDSVIGLNSLVGTNASAEGAGFLVDRDDDLGSLIYRNSSATRWAAGDEGAEVDLVGTTSSQTLENKTIVAADNMITTAASGNLTSTELNASLAELQGEIDKTAASVCQGRLTPESGVSNSATFTDVSTLYFTPHGGNCIGLWDGTDWNLHTFSEISIALSGLTSGKLYDVFIYDNAGSLAAELSAAWADDNTRTDAIAVRDGVQVKSSDHTRRRVGTFRATSATTTRRSQSKCFIYNLYNQLPFSVFLECAGGVHNYNTAAYRFWGGDSSNVLEFLCDPNLSISILASANAMGGTASTFAQASHGPAVNQSLVPDAVVTAPPGTVNGAGCAIGAIALNGYNYVAGLQRGTGAATNQFYFLRFWGTVWC